MANILVVDDDPLICSSLSLVIQKMGHAVHCSRTVGEAVAKVQKESFDIVFCDVRMPDGSGLDILPEIKDSAAAPEVIIMTGFEDPHGAELAIKKGAWDYVEKPLSAKDVTLSISRALQYREKKQAVTPAVALIREGIVGNSALIKACLDGLAQAASSQANVLIEGETGTGKELFALAIHKNSARAKANFVVVDCAALPETLVESTLFGHVRGAFTGADKPREGLIKQADCGTLFLDEVGELPYSIQKAFLRVLQEKRFRPVGGGQEVGSDFRLIAATNRNLEDMVKKGTFREDLFFRLRTLVIELPPLRASREDIKELVLYYIDKLCEQYKVPMKGFSSDFFDALMEYSWPGNVRELIQALEKAIVAAQDEPTLFSIHLPHHIRIQIVHAAASRKRPLEQEKAEGAEIPTGSLSLSDFREAGLARIERQYLRKLMKDTEGNVQEACRISGLSRSRLYTLLKKHQIPPSG
jgi:two-component system, NtrC family, response regulator